MRHSAAAATGAARAEGLAGRDVLDYLRSLGNALDIPRRMITFIGDYMRTYLVDGTPDFSGDTYFDLEDGEAASIKPEQCSGDAGRRLARSMLSGT